MNKQVDYETIKSLTRALIVAIGEDPEREGLKETPRRVAAYWREFIEYNPGNFDTTFESVKSDQLVIVTGLRVFSLCEHHLLPFWCNISIGYVTKDKVLGLSKFARIAHKYAHSLQLQERLVQEIALEVQEICSTENVAVLARGKHTCMIMRGVRTDGIMISSYMGGEFRDYIALRAEFMQLATGNDGGSL